MRTKLREHGQVKINVKMKGKLDKKRHKRYLLAKYSNDTTKKFKKGIKYHHRRTFSNKYKKNGEKSNIVFRTRIKKDFLDPAWLNKIIEDVTLKCYYDIISAAPIRTGGYVKHIKADTPNKQGYRYNFEDATTTYRMQKEHITYGSIYVEPDTLPNTKSGATYSDLARWLEFGTGQREITGAGNSTIRGMSPQPHWLPYYEIYKRELKRRIKEELRNMNKRR